MLARPEGHGGDEAQSKEGGGDDLPDSEDVSMIVTMIVAVAAILAIKTDDEND